MVTSIQKERTFLAMTNVFSLSPIYGTPNDLCFRHSKSWNMQCRSGMQYYALLGLALMNSYVTNRLNSMLFSSLNNITWTFLCCTSAIWRQVHLVCSVARRVGQQPRVWSVRKTAQSCCRNTGLSLLSSSEGDRKELSLQPSFNTLCTYSCCFLTRCR